MRPSDRLAKMLECEKLSCDSKHRFTAGLVDVADECKDATVAYLSINPAFADQLVDKTDSLKT